jgi:hypothetical protein
MSTILQWVVCIALGLAAAGYLAYKYFILKEAPGSACGKCKGCAAVSSLELLAQQEQGDSASRRDRMGNAGL